MVSSHGHCAFMNPWTSTSSAAEQQVTCSNTCMRSCLLHRAAHAPAILAKLPVLPYLPAAAVACILQHVPLHERLTSCALVCRTWAAAAATAPAVVNTELHGSRHLTQLQSWLGKHCAVVTSLTVTAPDILAWRERDKWRLLQLPVPQFTRLRTLCRRGG
jgi:hypothetical protein